MAKSAIACSSDELRWLIDEESLGEELDVSEFELELWSEEVREESCWSL